MLITATSLGVLALVSVVVGIGARRGRRSARRDASAFRHDLATARQSVESLRLGEREAAWAAASSANRLDRSLLDLGKADHEVARLATDLDDLRSRLSAADRDLERLRADYDGASTRIAVLEGDLDRSRQETAEVSDQIPGLQQRLSAVVRERDRLSSVAQHGDNLEAELAALGRVHQELTAVRQENATLRATAVDPASDIQSERAHIERLEEEIADLQQEIAEARAAASRPASAGIKSEARDVTGDGAAAPDPTAAARLVASEAARRDLQQQLAAIAAVRSAEQQASAAHISKLERLHIEIAERDLHIVDLRGEIAETATAHHEAADAVTRLEDELAELQTVVDAGVGPGDDDMTIEGTTYAAWDQMLRDKVARSVREATGRLEEEVGHLRIVVAEKERLLRQTSAAPTPAPDPIPVTAIHGIGPVIAGILAEHGVTTIEAIATLSDPDIDRLGGVMPVYPGRIRHDDWVGQAQALIR